MSEIAGAKVVGEVKEVYPKPFERPRIALDFKRIETFIGKEIGSKAITDILDYMTSKL